MEVLPQAAQSFSKTSAFSGVTLNLFARWGCAQGLVPAPSSQSSFKQSLFVIYASAGSRGASASVSRSKLEHNRKPGILRRLLLYSTQPNYQRSVDRTRNVRAGIQKTPLPKFS